LWPQSAEELKRFPGIGDYTAKAIAAICFQKKCLPIDGNVIRVFSRLYGIADPLNNSLDRKSVSSCVDKWAHLAPEGNHGFLAQALMDLGATTCRPGAKANCDVCPLQKFCWSFKHQKLNLLYPFAKNRRPEIKLQSLLLLYRQKKTRKVLVRQIPQGLALEGQWEFPRLDLRGHEQDFEKRLFSIWPTWGPVAHRITHSNYRAFLVDLGFWSGSLPEGHRWLSWAQLQKEASLSTLSRKLIKTVEKNRS